MEKIFMLAFHPVKIHSCYEKVVNLSLEGLLQQFDVSSPSVFVQRAQIPMREVKPQLLTNQSYIDRTKGTKLQIVFYSMFEQILHQSLESQGTEELCKIIQHCQDRVIKKGYCRERDRETLCTAASQKAGAEE
ncbi:hypothetical protein JOB18_028519 [Solea senegalensis]|uniref:Niban 1/2/3 domain-containing protein n=1 Tax=Solea senegalensis TaxID=28829 RepID=A0AAV6QQM6_SOLSE|nr:hypothetical protein JOB18_028519 [Solea senegalensis]